MVRLVEYPESSDDERETRSDGSQWSEVDETPSSPCDSFSYPMREEEEEEEGGGGGEYEEDEDYAPSEVDSVASSVDTDDLDPDNEMDEERPETKDENFSRSFDDSLESCDEVEEVIDLTQTEEKEKEKNGVFYAWKDLQEAFEHNPFKRRSVNTREEEDDDEENEEEEDEVKVEMDEESSVQQDSCQKEEKKTPNLFDVETGQWDFQAAFAPGVGEKKKTPHRRRHTPTAQHRSTGASPGYSTLFPGEQKSTTGETATGFTKQQSASPVKLSADTSVPDPEPTFSFPPPQVEIPVFAFNSTRSGAASAPITPDFTFGQKGSAAFEEVGDDIYMGSPTPRHTPAANSTSVDGGFTLGQSGKGPKPYNFVGHGVGGTSKSSASRTKPSSAAKVADNGVDTRMRSPSPPANRTPTNVEFLFGQGYKNRKAFTWGRQSSSESLQSSGSTSTAASAASGQTAGSSWTAKVPLGGVSAGVFGSSGPTTASAFFTPGVAGPTRNADRQKKKVNSSSPFAPQTNSNPSASPFTTSSASAASFGSSLFQEATRTRQRSENPFVPLGASAGRVSDATMPPPVPSATTFPSASFAFGSSNSTPFQAVDPPSFRDGVFGSAAASTASNTGAFGQVPFGNSASHPPFGVGEADTSKSQAEATDSFFPDQKAGNASIPTTDGFQMGSANAQKNARHNSRVRPRRSGMFATKNSPRKDAKLGAAEPEPSPGASSSPSTTPSPFGMHNQRSRKNARLRHTYGRSPPADPCATTTFQSHPPSSTFVSSDQPDVVRPTAKKGLASAFAAPSSTHFGPAAAQQASKPSAFSFASHHQSPGGLRSHSASHSTESSQPGKAEVRDTGSARPTFAGSRRILRAALRSAGVGAERVKSAPPTTTHFHRDEGDDEMESEDEHDWMELKRRGGDAHGLRQFEDAAEFYRQSIEALESNMYDDPLLDTHELRTDKAKLHANRAASLMMLMQLSEAQRECRRSIEVDATYARAYLRLGRIQVLLGDTAHAQANLDTAKQLMQGNSGEVRTSDEADLASLAKMEATIKKLTTLQGEIKWYADCGDFKQALVHTESALGLAPNSRKLQVQKARILLHQKEFEQIIQFCTSIVENQHGSHGKLSSPRGRGGSNSRSLKEKTVEKITIVGIELGLMWATTLHYQNKVEEAVRILNALEAVAPCSSHVIQLKRQWQEMKQLKHDGNERFKRGEYQEAVRFYSEAVQIDPQHQEFCAIIYCNRAAAHMGLERYHTAILDCNEALQRKPQYHRALLRRARCHVGLKMFHEAVKDFDRYLREQPNDLPTEATAAIRRERNEAKAAIAKAREEARQREAAKKRAEREQRQRRSNRWEESSWSDSRHYDNFRRGTSSSSSANSNNGSSYGSNRHQSSGAGSRASFMAPKTQRRTHYDVLGIEKAATNDQIKKAYRKLALVYHPDKAKTSTHADLFKEMTAAYTVLSDESARTKYDRELIYNSFNKTRTSLVEFCYTRPSGSASKLAALKEELVLKLPEVDSKLIGIVTEYLLSMVKQTKVVMSLVGSYTLYGEFWSSCALLRPHGRDVVAQIRKRCGNDAKTGRVDFMTFDLEDVAPKTRKEQEPTKQEPATAC
ncbi:hypothetical protein PF005_g10792 [Phytophthora fragariae]|uniref:J domain-containing protein n=2 Tax=Phytophthora fragariae TaxID=53985 RepID=A0A6A3UDD0_9STRA|nr:hypothetical protein PF009_g11948 [Phytophthora fragariae]KAE9011171.1 hypothetical protein PF011_g9489 [Phytophthora fragariae]KAE9119087.1 hypothetical protein PF007_g8688 [Phytophthora fragariae]KAE9145016.1 hypothetical protein PF006_g10093 [Phytophthora fragariae]KAE9211997.1 hypothetical protein PF005_g10792 [Phytophthora fragariae]